MDLAEIDANIARVGEVGERFTEDDAKLHVEFSKGAIQDNRPETVEERKKNGKKMTYISCDMVKIQKRGEKDYVKRVVWFDENESEALADNVRFKRLYEDFKAGRTAKARGTLLINSGFVVPELAAELAHEKIFTVEHLAAMDDGTAQKYMGGITLKQKAQQFLRLQSDEKVNVPEELAKRDATIADMQTKLEALTKAAAKK